ncbi:hypothetical protein [Synechococcus sp. MIT S1220]|uniref:hypothetical protein n=1 Tax=Synechococcus sp. MIT S1220 TaxID=3082549 RepID=UPI0039AFFD41
MLESETKLSNNPYGYEYRQFKPLSNRLKVEKGDANAEKTRQRPPARPMEPMPSYMPPLRASNKAQGVAVDSAADAKNYLASVGENEQLTPMDMHAAQMYLQGNDDALEVL